jgi:hypothetical protein
MHDRNRTVISETSHTNVVTMREVDLLKSGKVVDGSVFLSKHLAGEQVEFAAKLGRDLDKPEKNVDEVEFIQATKMDTGLVYENGRVNIGTDYNGEQVTIAARKVDEQPEEAHTDESLKNKATG